MALYTKGNKDMMGNLSVTSVVLWKTLSSLVTALQLLNSRMQITIISHKNLCTFTYVISSIHVFASLADQELPFSPINRPQSLLPLTSPYSCRANNVVFKDFQWQVK